MTIEGYFDGTAVRPLEPVDLKPQQKVFIDIPEPQESAEERKKSRLHFSKTLPPMQKKSTKKRRKPAKLDKKKRWTTFSICCLMMKQKRSAKK